MPLANDRQLQGILGPEVEHGRGSKSRFLVLNVQPRYGSSLVRTVPDLHTLLCRLMWLKAVPL